MAFNWTCPYCNHPQSVTTNNIADGEIIFYTSPSADGYLGLKAASIICENPDCMKANVTARIQEVKRNSSNNNIYWPQTEIIISSYNLLPESSARPQPDFIPAAIREDYLEACLIKDLSPKASATLARRCLQGMIRDFCTINERTLYLEINKLKSLLDEDKAPRGVSSESIEAIDAVRRVGNIGAHMEQDIDHIVPVEPKEAQILIGLIETLFEDWYVERDKRSKRFAATIELGAKKDQAKKQNT